MSPPRLLAISADAPPDALRAWLQLLADTGWRDALLRAPSLRPAEAQALHSAAHTLGLRLIHHARTPGTAPNLHLPSHAPAPTTRPSGLLGQSCHSPAELDAAFSMGCDYALLSPAFTPTSKPDDRRPTLGLAALLSAAAGRPVLALGGLNAQRIRALSEAGLYGAAVLGALQGEGAHQRARAMRQAASPAWTQ